MADRGLLQDPETEPQGQDLYRSERECSSHSDLGSPYRLAGYKVAPLSLEGGLVLLEYGRHASSESLYLQGSAGLAQRTLCDAAPDTQT